MPDAPAQSESILTESTLRATKVADRLSALAADLSHPEPMQSLLPADRAMGLGKLEAAVAALRGVAGLCDTADPSSSDASPQPPTP